MHELLGVLVPSALSPSLLGKSRSFGHLAQMRFLQGLTPRRSDFPASAGNFSPGACKVAFACCRDASALGWSYPRKAKWASRPVVGHLCPGKTAAASQEGFLGNRRVTVRSVLLSPIPCFRSVSKITSFLADLSSCSASPSVSSTLPIGYLFILGI